MTLIRLPGLIDPHVHLREPGQTHKEDFDSGTSAALAGGFSAVLAMPNTNPPLTDAASLGLAKAAAKQKARCDYAIFVGAGAENSTAAAALAGETAGLKLYLDQTFGPLRLDDLGSLRAHLSTWPKDRPVAAHAEGRSLAAVLLLAHLHGRSLHVCHVSRKDEILLIRTAKERGLAVTCEVTPHHLFLSHEEAPSIGARRAEVRPRLASPADRQALWENLAVIDCFATDHAPHTSAEKDGDPTPPGFPGLETALGLLWQSVDDGRLTIDDLVLRMHTYPRRIFGLPLQSETWIEVDPDAAWVVRSSEMLSRSGWSPYEGMRLPARVQRVILRGRTAYEDGRVLAVPGSGLDLRATTFPEASSFRQERR
ncbi:MAG TPA: amidohydrolase family protein [Anaerolineales bacterium]|nr:amidohydrolase family protein [Anaerolineales bacterium]